MAVRRIVHPQHDPNAEPWSTYNQRSERTQNNAAASRQLNLGSPLQRVENYCHKRAIKRGQRGSEITCSKERKNPTYVDQHQNAAREKLFEQTTDFCKFPMTLTKILPDRSCLLS